ncbi:MAG: cytochrome c oxidase subunit II [Candidatus Dormibacteraeota bacterium]|nr:cytochrome c oxidase subunit II [Candidatus Dormibacteraeota bacterium]MBV8445004.1 cytochrome c oxidase subunit II [Candidatus Dormibacteraeota bacterium]
MRNRRSLLTLLIVVWFVLAVVGDIGLALAPMPPGQASDLASSESLVIRLLAVIAWPVFSAVLAALVMTLFINRVAPPDDNRSPAELRGNQRLQTMWISATIVVVLSLAVYGTVALANDQPGAGISTVAAAEPMPANVSQPLEVQVIAQQWYFTYRYPAFGGVETDHLVIPVGQKIEFHITSLDVVHSFWFYALGVKADAVPLNDNVVTVTPQQTGTFRIQCSELCGLWHGSMSDDDAQIVSTSDFQSWIAQQQAADAPIMKFLQPYSHTYAPNPLTYPA